eukprot:Gb_18962 [translate_table: standard]
MNLYVLLGRHRLAIPSDFCSCKVLLHSFVPLLPSNGHFLANMVWSKERRFSLKCKAGSRVWSYSNLKSERSSPFCSQILEPGIRETGTLDNGIISLLPQLSKMQPILESFVVEAVATVMPRQKSLPTIQEEEEERQNLTGNVQIKSDHVSHGFKDRGSRESKRRRKIGEANKGKIPWNKGKKHSPETLALIRERTIIAMRNPEVRQKLSQCSRPHRVLPVAPSILWPSVLILASESSYPRKCTAYKLIQIYPIFAHPASRAHEPGTHPAPGAQVRGGAPGSAWVHPAAPSAFCSLLGYALVVDCLAVCDFCLVCYPPIFLPQSTGLNTMESPFEIYINPYEESSLIKYKCRSDVSRARISASMKRGWYKRHEKKLLQKACIVEWGENIAEAARKGGDGDDELNWNSYEILKENMNQEWLLDIAKKKVMKNSKLEEKRRCKRASKSDNQKLKISEAIKTKWADPVYRQRVQYGLRKFHGKAPALTLGRATEKWVSEVISGKEAQKTRNLYGSQTHVNKHKSLKLLPCARKKTLSSNLDPLTGSKLEMENKIRANQAAVDLKIRVATQRARLLIAEAEKAAKLLEPSAVKDAAVRASLYETRKLLAEATRAMGNAESCRNTDISILPRCSLTLTDAETFQSQHCMDASQLAASAVPAPGILNDSHCQPLSNNGKAYECDADKFRMDKSKCAYEKNMPFPSSEVGSGKFLQSVLSTFGAGEPEIETAGKLESMPGESLGKDSMLLAKLDSSGSSTIFNSYLISDEPTTKGTLGKLNAKSEQNINMDNVFCEETKSDGSSSGTNEARSVPIGNCFSTPKNMKKRWVCGRWAGPSDFSRECSGSDLARGSVSECTICMTEQGSIFLKGTEVAFKVLLTSIVVFSALGVTPLARTSFVLLRVFFCCLTEHNADNF